MKHLARQLFLITTLLISFHLSADCTPYKNNINCSALEQQKTNQYISSSVDKINHFGLDEVINLTSSVLLNHADKRSVQIISIINWVDNMSIRVKNTTGKDFTNLTESHKGRKIVFHQRNFASTNEKLRINNTGGIRYIDNDLLLVVGNCNISHASNSVILCTGNANISHSINNIVISNGNIEISHDGSFGPGSLIVSKHFVKVLHSNSSVFVFAENVKISHANNSDCINTGPNRSSHGSCNNINMAESYFDYSLTEH